jgi:Ice-binding-like
MKSRALTAGIIASSLFALVGAAPAQDPDLSPVPLGSASRFVILTKAGITDVPTSEVTGNVGTSPITGAADLLTCGEVAGDIYSVDAAGPLPCNLKDPTLLTAAVFEMEKAYTNAAGRTNPNFLNLSAGDIGGLTLSPGLYKWGTSVKIPTDVTISGASDDVWIFQIAGNLKLNNAMAVHLSGGARPQNIFWQVAGVTTLGTTSHFQGIILCKTIIAMKTGASIQGRLFSQTAVTLEKNVVKRP